MSPSAVVLAKSGRDEWLAALTGAEDEWLVELLSARPDLLLAAPADMDALAEAVLSPGLVRVCYETADRTTRQVLEALCVGPDPTDLDTLARVLGTEAGLLRPVVDRLQSSGLVLRRGERLVRNPGLRAAVPHPAGLGPSVRELLAAQPVHELTAIAGRVGIEAKGVKATLVAAIVAALSSPERVTALVAGGPDGTEAMARRMARAHLELRLGYDSYQASQSDGTPQGWLLRRGLLVSTAWGSATMPAEVALALRGGRLFESFVVTGPVVATAQVDASHVDRRASETALGLVADMTTVLDAWGADPAKVLQAGGLGVREVRRVAKLTGRNEAEAARLVELAALAGLADVDGDVAVPTVDYDRWVDLPVGSRWAWLARGWWEAPLHLSLAGAIDTKDKPIPPLLDRPPEPDALARRMLVVGMLAGAPAGSAVDPASLSARVDWQAPVLWQGGPARADRLVSWIWDETDLTGVTGGGAMSSFGRHLVDGDGEEAATALGLLSPPVTAKVVLQADLTAVVAGEPAAQTRRELDLLADVESAGAATVYRFSETSLRRGFDAGRTSSQILAVLSERAPKGVPQPLAYLVEDIGRRFGQVRVGAAGCYVRSDDPALIAEVTQAKKTARLHLRLLAPTVAVSDADPTTVERTLRDAGYLAAAEDADATLVLRRPPARRAPRRAERPSDLDGPDGLSEDLLAELLSDPDLMAAFTGPASGALPADLCDSLRRLGIGGDAGPGPIDLAAVVRQLRHPAPRAVDHAPRSGPHKAPPRPTQPFPQLHLLGAEPLRPTHIATDRAAVAGLLDQAWDQDWLVRLSYVNGQGAESEFYAEVTDVSRRTVRVRRLPKGASALLQLSRIRWARAATEAEEEAQLL